MPWISYSWATSSFLQAQKSHRPPVRLCKVSCDCDQSIEGWGKNSVTNLFLCNWLVFLTICEPYTAKPPWLHKPPGGYITYLLPLIWAKGFEKVSPLNPLAYKNFCFLQSGSEILFPSPFPATLLENQTSQVLRWPRWCWLHRRVLFIFNFWRVSGGLKAQSLKSSLWFPPKLLP
jgi:hypothetical protein